MLKKLSKLLGVGALALILSVTSVTAKAQIEPRSVLCDPIETVHLAPNTGITIECYSQLRWTGTLYSFEGRSMTKSHGTWSSGPTYSLNNSTGTVTFSGTVQLVSEKDTVRYYHYQ